MAGNFHMAILIHKMYYSVSRVLLCSSVVGVILRSLDSDDRKVAFGTGPEN